MNVKVGILSLQGDYEKHGQILSQLDIEPVFVRYSKELDNLDGLVLPGGESTTISKLLIAEKMHEPLKNFGLSRPVLGTCAGLIMMATEVNDPKIKPLSLLDIIVERNGFGRQVDSFTESLTVDFGEKVVNVPATFIRAPKIKAYGNNVSVLATYNDEPVVVKSGNIMGMSFHPELDNIDIFHKFLFLQDNTVKNQIFQEQLNAS